MSSGYIVKGAKVALRKTNRADIAHYIKWKNPNLKAWSLDAPWANHNLTAIINWRKRWLNEGSKPPYRFLEVEASDGTHVGWVVVYHDDGDPHMTEIGIDIPEEGYWGQGIGTEALALWIQYIFETMQVERLSLSTWSGNQGMIKVGQKLGFQEEGRIRRGCRVDYQYYDRIHMGLLKTEWHRG
ncbi:GNAT family N-acetyltransferase [Fusibacter ferrireducens]|uniref:GNAT family N-acetyltransferase n=1 Tax=Fusibacter ferrireducens TaxID=2785058 RepID=A0ABR9ZR27_9FIRM|nr:GNAT family protein [Fusibacter ferrireducens]MBF4692874.1 GNAT family N-acetyltransferase [Fusibacter ferrireducens]